MSGDVYRLSWEMVDVRDLKLFSSADPTFYSNSVQLVPNSRIPDTHWHRVTKETADPWDQYNTLCEWAREDRGFVRNVTLEVQTTKPTWAAVDAVARTE